jgi:hypothetical protein
MVVGVLMHSPRAEIVVRVLLHSPRAEGEWTMHQNPVYYFGIVLEKCNIIVIIMLTVHPGTIYRSVKNMSIYGVTLTF